MSKQPSDSQFKQQRMPAWQPVLTPTTVIPTFFIVGMIFLPVGILVLQASQGVKESPLVRYDNILTPPGDNVTRVDFVLSKDMKAPVYLYYQLSNFYQNHRRYVKSRSDEQLAGENPNRATVIDCEPLRSENSGSSTNLYFPCGLVANSWFNDTIRLERENTPIALQKEGIAWPSDKSEKFKAISDQDFIDRGYLPPKNIPDWSVDDVEDEDFIVWMRTAGLSKFRKLYRKIDTDLVAGSYTFVIENNFPVESFKGTKHLILSTTSWLGGKNDFLGIAYCLTGTVCLLLGLIFLVKHKDCKRPIGDTS